MKKNGMDQRLLTDRLGTALSLLYPPHCPVCDRILSPFGRKICAECAGKLPYITETKCIKCGREVSSSARLLCDECTRYPHVFDQGLACFYYTGGVQQAVLRLKRGDRRDYVCWMGECLTRLAGPLLPVWKPDLIAAVPMTKRKKRARGYNQAELLAREVSTSLQIPFEKDCLIKKRETGDQKELSRAMRARNLAGAFEASGKAAGRNVIVVDDVFTTGSTMDAAASALKQAGAQKVYSLCLCLVG